MFGIIFLKPNCNYSRRMLVLMSNLSRTVSKVMHHYARLPTLRVHFYSVHVFSEYLMREDGKIAQK